MYNYVLKLSKIRKLTSTQFYRELDLLSTFDCWWFVKKVRERKLVCKLQKKVDLSTKSIAYSIKPVRKMTLKQRFSIIFAIFVTISSAEWNTNDYMKRVHSLVKPYQGKLWKMSFFVKITWISRELWMYFIHFRLKRLGFSWGYSSDEYTH